MERQIVFKELDDEEFDVKIDDDVYKPKDLEKLK